MKTVPSDFRIPPTPVTASKNSFSVLTIEEPGMEEDTVEVEVEREGATSPSDSMRRGKKP